MSVKKCSLSLKTKLESDMTGVKSYLKSARPFFNLPGKDMGLVAGR